MIRIGARTKMGRPFSGAGSPKLWVVEGKGDSQADRRSLNPLRLGGLM